MDPYLSNNRYFNGKEGFAFVSLLQAELVKSLMTYVPKKLRLMEELVICSDVFERFGRFLKPECLRLVV